MEQTLSQSITSARNVRKMTPYRLARLAGVAPHTVARVEEGHDTQLSTLVKIAAQLGMRVALVPVEAAR